MNQDGEVATPRAEQDRTAQGQQLRQLGWSVAITRVLCDRAVVYFFLFLRSSYVFTRTVQIQKTCLKLTWK